MNALVWSYPELGMDVVMQDRMLSEYYLLPITRDFDPDPVPNPAALERQPDRLALSGGRGVFRTLPPGVTPMTIHGQVARFMTDHGPRLLANVEAAGTPSDTMRAEWTVLDTARREVARQASDLSPSACDPGQFRVADFAADLPPGRYLVGLTVRTGTRRGVYRSEIEVGAEAQALAISDVVVTCGTPGPEAAAPPLRMMPNPEARIGPTDPLTAYFEIYHLSPDSVGQSRFEYVCTVRSIERDPRVWVQRMFSPRPHPADVSATRQDEVAGTIRRQFVSVPVQSLPPGHYQLEVRVRDLVAGGASVATTPFVKLPAYGFRD